MTLFKTPCGSSQLILPKVLWHKYKKHEGLVLSTQVQVFFALQILLHTINRICVQFIY